MPSHNLAKEISTESVRPVFALMDALRWLEWQRKQERVSQWRDMPTRYLVGRGLSNAYFTAVAYQKKWLVIAQDMPALHWFPHLPWEGVVVRPKAGVISLICGPVTFPDLPEMSGMPGQTLPYFGVDLETSRNQLAKMPGDLTELRIGLFQAKAEGGVRITHASPRIPATISSAERR